MFKADALEALRDCGGSDAGEMGLALEGALIDFLERTCPGRGALDLDLGGALMLGALDRGLLEIDGRLLVFAIFGLLSASPIVSTYVPG